jgi:hypothetical protein
MSTFDCKTNLDNCKTCVNNGKTSGTCQYSYTKGVGYHYSGSLRCNLNDKIYIPQLDITVPCPSST